MSYRDFRSLNDFLQVTMLTRAANINVAARISSASQRVQLWLRVFAAGSRLGALNSLFLAADA